MSNLFKVACLALLQASLFSAPVSAQPPPPPAFELVNEEGDSGCSVTPDGLCILSDDREKPDYKPNARCNFLVLRKVKLDVDHFHLGADDRLRVANVPYKGKESPQDVVVQEGKRIRFIAEEVVGIPANQDEKEGFKICAGTPSPNPWLEWLEQVNEAGDDAACVTLNTPSGDCIYSDPSNVEDYGKSFRCIWKVKKGTRVYSHFFDLGEHDRLRVNNEPYKGTDGPNGVKAKEDTWIKFIVEEKEGTPNNMESDNGFKVCTFPPIPPPPPSSCDRGNVCNDAVNNCCNRCSITSPNVIGVCV